MTKLSKTLLTFGLGAAIVATASFADSHAAKDMAPAVAARHYQMQMVGHNIGILGGIAKGEVEFDAAVVKSAATNLNLLAKMDRTTLWTAGTEQGAAAGSRSKAEVWSDPDGFGKKFDDLALASATLMEAGDLDAVRAGMGALGGACKACHETYRGPKN